MPAMMGTTLRLVTTAQLWIDFGELAALAFERNYSGRLPRGLAEAVASFLPALHRNTGGRPVRVALRQPPLDTVYYLGGAGQQP
jgi:hypothetical protein